MFIMLFKYHVTFIALFVGMTLIHPSLQIQYGRPENRSLQKITFYTSDFSPACRTVQSVIEMLGMGESISRQEFKLIDRDHLKDKDFLEAFPLHKVPAIIDSNYENYKVFESTAIVRYLIDKYATEAGKTQLIPTSGDDYDRFNIFLSFDQSTLGHALIKLYSEYVFDKSPITQYTKKLLENALKEFAQLLKVYHHDGVFNNYKINVADVFLASHIVTIQTIDKSILKEFNIINDWFKKVKSEIHGFDEVHNPGLTTVKQLIENRTQEELQNPLYAVSISNKDVSDAIETLLKAIQYHVVSNEYRLTFISLQNDMKNLSVTLTNEIDDNETVNQAEPQNKDQNEHQTHLHSFK